MKLSSMLRHNNYALLPSQLKPLPEVLPRELVQLSCVEPKEFVTPYNENTDSYLLSGMYVYDEYFTMDCLHELSVFF